MVNNWLFKILSWVIPLQCTCCHGTVSNTNLPLCSICRRELPRIEHPCVQCGLPLPRETPVGSRCGACLTEPPAFDHLIAACRYDTPLSSLITAYKFNQQLHHARLFAGLIHQAIQNARATRPEVIIPVPLHPRRQRQRGYNQALEIARLLRQICAIPVRHDLLRRARHTSPQSNLDLSKRARNVRRAFQVTKSIPYRHVVLLDDVVTTGNTVNEIARELKKQGVATVSVWCVARVV